MTRPPTPEEMRKHILELAEAFNIEVCEDPRLTPDQGASMQIGIPGVMTISIVVFKPITDDTSYAVALHELGHKLHPSGSIRTFLADEDNMNMKVTEEESAWEWAQHHSLIWTTGMEQVKLFGLNTYYRERDRRRLEAIKPKRVESISDFMKRR